ncbi:MAG: pyruvate dehydrogenase (acetyl-transferring) E1 component subunit alpha [Candidatus Nanopelagicaceae bacterium]|nr:pyruvate dehydrogenase (acetyl-transferring) E1 component subunit alpha [Candidatus Nanopelagicaceae bacterium]
MDQLDPIVQLLDCKGSIVEDSQYQSTLDDAALFGLYRDMVLVRQLDEQATALQRQGELGLWAPLLGQEAAQIGSARAMHAQDYAFTTYREHGVAWCRGVDPVDMLRFWRGTMHQAWDANLHRLYGYQVIIGAHALHATGYAMGARLAGQIGTGETGRDQAVMAYFGDGAMSEGDVNEAFVFATAYQAPVVFFCQNNQWAISEPTKRQSLIPLAQRADGFGLPGVRVDGNDVIACHAVTAAALNRARSGQGPTLIEAVTYRMGAHTTSDDPTKYRDSADDELWRGRDPIERLRIHLRAKGLLTDELQSELAREASSLAERMREGCRELPDPKPLSMFDHVYAGPDARIDAQRREVEAIHSAGRVS